MSVLTINGTTSTEGGRTWSVECTDAFGRPCQLAIAAYRHPVRGIGIGAPTGEYAFVDVHHIPVLAYVLAEACQFMDFRGGESVCAPKS